ncbi:MAG: metal-binding protein [Piscirickettsiaceae bacterium]|nr:MAG: metal-binding protein [Piscirickettsiaceae bacterium]
MPKLIDFFNADDVSEDAMYYVEMHGFLTSLAIQPVKLSQTQIIEEIVADTPVNQTIKQAIVALQDSINQSLFNGDFPDTPTIDEDEDSLKLWSTGFMQGVFMQEHAWFADFPEDVAELTLPMLSCSELLDEALDEISQNDELLDDMAEKIPDCVIDLYLLFNSPDS